MYIHIYIHIQKGHIRKTVNLGSINSREISFGWNILSPRCYKITRECNLEILKRMVGLLMLLKRSDFDKNNFVPRYKFDRHSKKIQDSPDVLSYSPSSHNFGVILEHFLNEFDWYAISSIQFFASWRKGQRNIRRDTAFKFSNGKVVIDCCKERWDLNKYTQSDVLSCTIS